MTKYSLDTPIAKLPRINERYLKKFHKLGLNTVRDLIYHFPNRYDDFSKIITMDKLKLNEVATIQGEILKIDNIHTFKRRMSLTEALVKDPTASVKVIWFNQPFLIKNLKEGKRVSLSGKYSMGPKGLYLSNPSYELLLLGKTTTHTAGLVPIYPETIGLSSRFLRYYIKLVLPTIIQIKEFLPYEILKKYNLPNLQTAIKNIHFPKNLKSADEARRRFIFEELFLLQLFVLKQKKKLQQENTLKISFNKDLIQAFVKKLPFELTNAQKKTAWEIILDLKKSHPMNRLLQGDVGSGKTVVAAMAGLEVAKAGFQVAFMAPTEILAQQHFKEIKKLLTGFDIEIGLLTGSEKKVSKKTKIFIGTHALIQKSIKFNNLALVIVDEQHRFGVEQRAVLLRNNNYVPHLLSMTATPIPRTLALTIYGDLDISILDEMPKNRKKIITKIVPPDKREQAYEFIRREVKNGRQCFVICPRIDPSTSLGASSQNILWAEAKAVKEEYEKLSEKIFPDLKIDMIHGRIKTKEKKRIMTDFRNNKIDVLVSTSVIEVGIDIPNATIMMIEGADRFGLAQLHQFRGRVGRDEYQSYCLLFSTSGETTARLRALQKCDNGFELAEKDMEIRGPGQFYGIAQSGLPDLVMANLKNLELIKSTRHEAFELLKKDLNLRSYPLLAEKLSEFKKTIHLE
ncbi:ATP-dependent DNA helicase RecG [Patescibacteria group bacterium]|nr:ATP-dependent DNA helicase RecG [Patescibacteria group bacterium]MBU4458668.1 ATP-dependent DNA helicase RecG [Patescibacteria group bacterium]MCG2696027.1 ATP-dependent DNA helicase RecG [Candidatus Portnoybacteria bacterium]